MLMIANWLRCKCCLCPRLRVCTSCSSLYSGWTLLNFLLFYIYRATLFHINSLKSYIWVLINHSNSLLTSLHRWSIVLEFNTHITTFTSFFRTETTNHGPADVVHPVLTPSNPYCSILFVLTHCSFRTFPYAVSTSHEYFLVDTILRRWLSRQKIDVNLHISPEVERFWLSERPCGFVNLVALNSNVLALEFILSINPAMPKPPILLPQW